MDCRVKPGHDKSARASRRSEPETEIGMRPKIPTSLIALLLVAPLLAGCLERGQPPLINSNGDDDDAFCRANNVKAGSSEYIACRKDRDVQRSNAEARADRKQRDLGEFMLNHPSVPDNGSR
jgi:hypothetical protein